MLLALFVAERCCQLLRFSHSGRPRSAGLTVVIFGGAAIGTSPNPGDVSKVLNSYMNSPPPRSTPSSLAKDPQCSTFLVNFSEEIRWNQCTSILCKPCWGSAGLLAKHKWRFTSEPIELGVKRTASWPLCASVSAYDFGIPWHSLVSLGFRMGLLDASIRTLHGNTWASLMVISQVSHQHVPHHRWCPKLVSVV